MIARRLSSLRLAIRRCAGRRIIMRSRAGVRPFGLLIPVVAAVALQPAEPLRAERAGSSTASVAAPASKLPFQDPKLSPKARIEDLLGRLTLAEKISLL